MNNDGYIDASDLEKAFLSMGRVVGSEEIDQWVQLRDSTGRGMVSFQDFVAHYITK
jgi:Ca2+-binding EF-hand superfamily protein